MKGVNFVNEYYVYEHVRLDNNAVFYVGKGKGDRCRYKHRNEKHDYIMEKYGMKVNIVENGLTESEAYNKEYELINHYINEEGYGIDIIGLEGNDPDKFLTNKTFGSQGSIGISNPQFNVSPKDRMTEEVYNNWLEKTVSRLEKQTGKNNPNYNNKTLHNKVKDDKELRIKYYSRPGAQNGRAQKIKVYDINMNYINTFDTIGEAAQWIKDELNLSAKIDSIRTNIRERTKKGKPYKNMYFEYC